MMRGLGHERNLLHRIVHLRHQPAQREMVVTRAVKRERENRHVVNGLGLDERRGNAVRNAVEVLLQLLVQLHDAALHVLADLEAHDDQALAGARGGVDVFDAGNFPEQLFHRARGAFLDFLGAEAGHGDQHVHHRDFDLRLLLARQHDDRERAEQHDAMTISGVSLESMNVRATLPARPRAWIAEQLDYLTAIDKFQRTPNFKNRNRAPSRCWPLKFLIGLEFAASLNRLAIHQACDVLDHDLFTGGDPGHQLHFVADALAGFDRCATAPCRR